MERISHPEIVPAEIGELWVKGRALWEWRCDPEFACALRKALEILRAGGGATCGEEPVPAIVSGFEAVYLTGGGFNDRELTGQWSGLSCALVFGAERVFAGERPGFDLLRTRGLSGWVADLGQSQFKLAAPGHRWRFPRDPTRLRMAGQVSSAEMPAQRRRLREFIALRLQMAMTEISKSPRALVFALPGRMAADGTPMGSTYAGMGDDRTLLPDALEQAGLHNVPLFVLNDAELAALGALSDPRLAGFRKVLVLTLGFGIGAALIHREDGTMRLSSEKPENKGCSASGLC